MTREDCVPALILDTAQFAFPRAARQRRFDPCFDAAVSEVSDILSVHFETLETISPEEFHAMTFSAMLRSLKGKS